MHLTQIQSRYGVATTSTPRPGGSLLGVAVELATPARSGRERGAPRHVSSPRSRSATPQMPSAKVPPTARMKTPPSASNSERGLGGGSGGGSGGGGGGSSSGVTTTGALCALRERQVRRAWRAHRWLAEERVDAGLPEAGAGPHGSSRNCSRRCEDAVAAYNSLVERGASRDGRRARASLYTLLQEEPPRGVNVNTRRALCGTARRASCCVHDGVRLRRPGGTSCTRRCVPRS